MKNIVTVIAAAAFAIAAIANDSVPEAPAPQEGSSKLAALVGSWRGTAELKEADKPAAVKLAVRIDCKRASGGWGVQCATAMTSPQMNLLETDLFGYDAESGKVHWYAVTNAGDVHDHAGTWTDPHHLVVRHTADKLTEDVNLALTENRMAFESITNVAGSQVATVRGEVKKQ